MAQYLGNKSKKEVHDIYNEQTNCQLREIKDKVFFNTLIEARGAGYDNCAYCLGSSRR